jgi:hypothetical protein
MVAPEIAGLIDAVCLSMAATVVPLRGDRFSISDRLTMCPMPR